MVVVDGSERPVLLRPTSAEVPAAAAAATPAEQARAVEAYVLQVCQLSPEAIAHLRRNLVVGAPEGDGCRQSHSGRIEPLKHIACATLVSETTRAL